MRTAATLNWCSEHVNLCHKCHFCGFKGVPVVEHYYPLFRHHNSLNHEVTRLGGLLLDTPVSTHINATEMLTLENDL